MQILINGEPQETGATTLADLCTALGFAGAKIATAINGTFVPTAAREAALLAEGDRIEIVAPRQGG